MGRPKLHSDDAILDAAREVLLEKGPSSFTLSDVAARIGLSRAALIQRFKDRQTLHYKVMEQATREVRDYMAAASPETGLDALWTLLKDLIEGLGEGENFAGYLLLEWSDVQDESLNRLARERNRMVRAAIAERLPPDGPDREEAAGLVQAVIQGAAMQWLIEKNGALDAFTRDQTRRILALLYPHHVFD